MPTVEIHIPDDVLNEHQSKINFDLAVFCSRYGLRCQLPVEDGNNG